METSIPTIGLRKVGCLFLISFNECGDFFAHWRSSSPLFTPMLVIIKSYIIWGAGKKCERICNDSQDYMTLSCVGSYETDAKAY